MNNLTESQLLGLAQKKTGHGPGFCDYLFFN